MTERTGFAFLLMVGWPLLVVVGLLTAMRAARGDVDDVMIGTIIAVFLAGSLATAAYTVLCLHESRSEKRSYVLAAWFVALLAAQLVGGLCLLVIGMCYLGFAPA